MKKFKNLLASDFPGVDPKEFDEWKQAGMRTRGFIYVVLVIYLVLNIKLYGTTGSPLYDTPIVIIIGFLLDSPYTRYAISNYTLYTTVALCFLIVFNIALFLSTGRYIGESIMVIVVLLWLFYQNHKHNQTAIDLGIDNVTLHRILSK